VLVETDCSTLVQALGKNVINRVRWAGIITEIKEMSRLLPMCKFSHTQRGTNQVAHDLGQLAMRRRQCKVMRFSIPPRILPLVIKDTQEIVSTDTSCNPNP
jgi:hypothetical protein